MTYDEFLIQEALGSKSGHDLWTTDDVELLSSAAKSINPPEDDRLDLKWLQLCAIARNEHTPLDVLCDMAIRFEDHQELLCKELQENIYNQHHTIMKG